MSVQLTAFIQAQQAHLFDPTKWQDEAPLLCAFIEEITPKRPWHHGQFADFATGRDILKLSTVKWLHCLRFSLNQLLALELKVYRYRVDTVPSARTMWGDDMNAELLWQQRMNWFVAVRSLLKRHIALSADDVSLLLLWLNFDDKLFGDIWLPLTEVINWLSNQAEKQQDLLTDEHKRLLIEIKQKLEPIKQQKANRLLYEALEALLDGRPRIKLQPGEAWSDLAIADLKVMTPLNFNLWCELIDLCKQATMSKPSKKWQNRAERLVNAIGLAHFEQIVFTWFAKVPEPRTLEVKDWAHLMADPNLLIIDEHVDILRGLVWALALSSNPQTPQTLEQLALTSYVKVPGVGQRAVKLGSACIFTLAQLPQGKAVLVSLQQQLDFKGALRAIEKVLG